MVENLTSRCLDTMIRIVSKLKEGDDYDDVIGTVEVETYRGETKFKLKILHETETEGSFSKDDVDKYFFEAFFKILGFDTDEFVGKISFVFYGKSYHKGWISKSVIENGEVLEKEKEYFTELDLYA